MQGLHWSNLLPFSLRVLDDRAGTLCKHPALLMLLPSGSSTTALSVASRAGLPTAHSPHTGHQPHHCGCTAVQAPLADLLGFSCRFPESRSPAQFWDNLASGRDMVTEDSQRTLV